MRTIAIDFDGVLHSYSSGWCDAHFIPDPPVPGAMQWLYSLVRTDYGQPRQFDPVIFSSRSHQPGAIAAMQSWIRYWAKKELSNSDPEYQANAVINYFNQPAQWPTQKPSAFVSIDDRGIQFDGTFDKLTPELLVAFKPWNKP